MSGQLVLAVILIAIQIGFGAIVVRIAKRKGLREVPWVVIGYSLGPLALPMVWIARDKSGSRK
jgi:hypothetical protein